MPARKHGGLAGGLIRFWRDRRGSISPLLVMALVPLIGAMAMGTEATNWWLLQRQAQNAADSAVIAAANEGSVNGVSSSCTVTGDWCNEARSVAKQYGFTNGSLSTTVTPLANQACPSPLTATDCFKVTITRVVPVTLLSVVGYKGTGGGGNQTITASAMAYATGGGGATTNFCVVALGTAASKDLTVNGGPNSNLPGCAIGSNGATDCHGQGIPGIDASYAAPGDTDNCDQTSADNLPLRAPIKDPYTAQATDIPANTCPNPTLKTSYPQEPKHGSPPAANQITGTPTWSGTTKVLCGDIQLTGNVTLSAGTVMVIENGMLDLNNFTLTATNSTIIFTGPSINGFSPAHIIEDNAGGTGGTINITAPSGTWNGATTSWTGFAVYQDPSLSSGIDMTFAGNSPTLNITGLYYGPNSNVTISGVVGSANACIGFMVLTFIINGTGEVIDSPNCAAIDLSGSNEGFLAGQVVLVK
jgi:Flp pilus assembly protein TadG